MCFILFLFVLQIPEIDLKSGILNIYALPKNELELIMNHFVRVELPAKTVLIESGQVSDKMYFISNGCMRSYYQDDDKDVTLWLGHEGDFITCFRSWLNQSAGHENIQLNETCVLYYITRKDLLALSKDNVFINNFYRKIIEDGFLYWENRTIMFLFKTARERYEHLIEKYPLVMQRWPLNQIASYLGITQETLSRLRAGK